jgi:hypothetical protein
LKHLYEKYFSFRTVVIEEAQARAPHSARLIRLTEFMRLGLSAACALLFAIIFWDLAITAFTRGPFGAATAAFFILAIVPTVICLVIVKSCVAALRG